MKKVAAAIAVWLLSAEARPIEVRLGRAAGLAVLAFLGVKYA